ncbi:MAG TPA: peptidyl-prolyl cis-trans isomerase [Epsilonproteobacteria bacterium]|nr:peptidyl-prolyl cis-trans isomerase [Campylobacterota bacterium]
MKKILTILVIFATTFLSAKMTDGIAIVVENEPITLAEIRAVQQGMQVSREQAIEILIQDRLQKSAMNAIVVTETEVDQKIKEIATNNKVTMEQMQKILQEQNVSWAMYRENIKNEIKKQKFFQEQVSSSIPTPTDDELKMFYSNNIALFSLPKTIRMVEYKAKSKQKMQMFLQNPLGTSGVTSKILVKKPSEISPSLLPLLLETNEGSLTPPVNAGDGYVLYYVQAKKGTQTIDFETAKPNVLVQWREQQKERALKDYFEKLRTRATIETIRE